MQLKDRYICIELRNHSTLSSSQEKIAKTAFPFCLKHPKNVFRTLDMSHQRRVMTEKENPMNTQIMVQSVSRTQHRGRVKPCPVHPLS